MSGRAATPDCERFREKDERCSNQPQNADSSKAIHERQKVSVSLKLRIDLCVRSLMRIDARKALRLKVRRGLAYALL
jgi:hypothetical protein